MKSEIQKLQAMKRAYFVTGTDTGVGKTTISSALVHQFAALGLRSVGMKPIASGCVLQGGVLLSEDVQQLQAASNLALPLADINPYAFEPAIAPHIAASQAGVEIDLDVIQAAYARLESEADVVIVEGVGGFRVPLNDSLDTADLAVALGLPVIMVVGLRLGCINHALLTAEAIAARGLTLVGWIANLIDPAMSMQQENLEALSQRLPAPCLGVVPWVEAGDFTAIKTDLASAVPIALKAGV